MHLESIVCLVIAVVAIILWLREKCRVYALRLDKEALMNAATLVVGSVKNVDFPNYDDIYLLSFRELVKAHKEVSLAYHWWRWLRRLRCNTERASEAIEARERDLREAEDFMVSDLEPLG